MIRWTFLPRLERCSVLRKTQAVSVLALHARFSISSNMKARASVSLSRSFLVYGVLKIYLTGSD